MHFIPSHVCGKSRAYMKKTIVFALSSTMLLTSAWGTSTTPTSGLSADLVRLANHARGRIHAGSPSFDNAISAYGGYGFGKPGCDAAGFAYRPVTHSQPKLKVHVPIGAQRMEIVLRPTHGRREVTISEGNHTWATFTLRWGWQRVLVRVDATHQGPRTLTFTFARATDARDEGPSMPAKTRALMHAILFKSRKLQENVIIGASRPVRDGNKLWLEAGEITEIPLTPQSNQALITTGLANPDKAKNLTLQVRARTVQGAYAKLFETSGLFDMPWNLDLSRRGETTPLWLRFETAGTGQGALGLRTPMLTTSQVIATPPSTKRPTPSHIVIIAVPGLRYKDVVRLKQTLPGTLYNDVWSSSTEPRASLASLLTGHHPAATRVHSRRHGLSNTLATLTGRLAKADFSTWLVGGGAAMAHPSMVRDFATIRRPGIAGLRPHAAALLTAAFKELKQHQGKKSFGLAVLGDVDALAAPRTPHWRRFAKDLNPLPWPVGETRRRLLAAQKANRQFKPNERRYLEALRLGRITDVFDSIQAFWRQTRRASHPWIVVVGLGGTPQGQQTTADDLHIPLWMLNTRPPSHAPRQPTLGLIDLTAALAEMGRTAQREDLPGLSPHLWQQGTWSWPTFAETPRGSYLVRESNRLLWVPFKGTPQLLEYKGQATSQPWTNAKAGPAKTFHIDLMKAIYGTQVAAKERWERGRFTATLTTKSQPGTRPTCGQ
jgi:hypothetical protein